MKHRKETFITALALFSLFFGAGNLILPPLLGFKAGQDWSLVVLGFSISAVFIPILGIIAHARLQGTMFDFARKISPVFSLIYCYTVYAISIALPSPRTASVTHEMAIAPIFNSPPLATSIAYFALVFIFVINRSKILDIIGKFLTPAIILILLAIIGTSLFSFQFNMGASSFAHPISEGILEGYQTFDAIGAVVVGGVIIISLNLKNGFGDFEEKKKMIARSGWMAGMALLIIYAGLILTGALFHDQFEDGISRTGLLNGISNYILGSNANLALSILISLACFTTAVGIVAGTADFVKSRFGNSQRAYFVVAFIGAFLGVLMGQLRVDYIIAVALPALMFIYPITIVLIILNVLPEKWAAPSVFRWVVGVTILFSIPDFLNSIGWGEKVSQFTTWIPLKGLSLGWVIPAILVFSLANFRKKVF